MNNGGDAAEQIVRLSLEGFEVAVRLTGSAAKNIAILLASVLKQEISQSNKTRGKARLTNMIKSGNSECAWQSLKTLDMEKRKKFATYKAAGAKKMGRRVELRSDWEEVKYQLMVDVCYAKFSQNKELKSILQATGEEELIENTTAWHDNVWGNCECERCKETEGKNLLGKALMEVRSKLK